MTYLQKVQKAKRVYVAAVMLDDVTNVRITKEEAKRLQVQVESGQMNAELFKILPEGFTLYIDRGTWKP